MFDKYLRLLIVFSCILGLLGILFVYFFYETHTLLVVEVLNLLPDENTYVVFGNVKEATIKSNTLFFKLCDVSVCVPCVYFNPSKAEQEVLHKSNKLYVKAKYTTYNQEPELLVYSFWEE